MAPFNIPTMFTPSPDYVANEFGIDPDEFERLIRAESNFNPSAVSSAGAQGLTQLMPGTAAELGVTDPFDPVQSMYGGASYYKQQQDKFGELAPVAYNWGPGNTQDWLESGADPSALPKETRDYTAKLKGELPNVPSFSPSKYADVEFQSARSPSYSPRRERDLSRVTDEITTLENQKTEALQSMTKQGELDPDQAIAMALTAILPTLLGFGFGGLQGGAMGAQAGLAGANVGLQGLTAEMNRRDNTNKLVYEDARQRLTAKESEARGINDAMSDAEELGARSKFNADAIAGRAGGASKPLTREQATVIQKMADGERLTVDDRLILGSIPPYVLQTNLYGTGSNLKRPGDSQIDRMTAGEGARFSIGKAKELAGQFTPGVMSALRAGKITNLYKDPSDPAYQFYAQIEKLKKEVARMNDSGALTQLDVDMFKPLVEGSPVYDTQETIQERLDELNQYIENKRNNTLGANRAGGRTMSGFSDSPPAGGSSGGTGAKISFEEYKKRKAEGRL